MATQTELAFHEDMVQGIRTLKSEIGYNPTRFSQMVAELGGVEAARRLLAGTPEMSSDGFERLEAAGKLDMSVEFFALLPWYSELFTPDERETALWRLERHGLDVDTRLRQAARTPPAWTAS